MKEPKKFVIVVGDPDAPFPYYVEKRSVKGLTLTRKIEKARRFTERLALSNAHMVQITTRGEAGAKEVAA